jgi:hypothetical protein
MRRSDALDPTAVARSITDTNDIAHGSALSWR